MLILALDTTGRSGSLALARDNEILEARSVDAPQGFGHILYQEIQRLLARHGAVLADVDCYAAAAGPGSFTGIRVGLAAAKALAEVHGKKIVPVSNLLALASLGAGHYRAPVLDARRGEVFAAVYDERLRPVVDEVVLPWQDFLRLVGDHEVTFITHDPALFQPGGVAELGPNNDSSWHHMVTTAPLALAVSRVAVARCHTEHALPPEAVDANYIRRTDAELNWKDPA